MGDIKDVQGMVVYLLLHTRGYTYIGATVNLARRIRQHNGELSGGARRTSRMVAAGCWSCVIAVAGFQEWRDALRFEYAWRRCCKRVARGARGARDASWRTRGLHQLLCKRQWSSTSPLAAAVPLVITAALKIDGVLPSHVQVVPTRPDTIGRQHSLHDNGTHDDCDHGHDNPDESDAATLPPSVDLVHVPYGFEVHGPTSKPDVDVVVQVDDESGQGLPIG